VSNPRVADQDPFDPANPVELDLKLLTLSVKKGAKRKKATSEKGVQVNLLTENGKLQTDGEMNNSNWKESTGNFNK